MTKIPKEATDGVTLITLHAAKGLEFVHVFLVGVEDGLLPHERSKAEGEHRRRARLFYVGMTRAMRSLVITWCRSRKKFGERVFGRPSPVLARNSRTRRSRTKAMKSSSIDRWNGKTSRLNLPGSAHSWLS